MSDINKDSKEFLAALIAEDQKSFAAPAGVKREASDDLSALAVAKKVKTADGPLAFAKNRQALCDALPYFKSHQGGLYTIESKPHGLLVSGAGFEIRDQLGHDIVITSM